MTTELTSGLNSASKLMQANQLPNAYAAVSSLKRKFESEASVWALSSEISLRQGNVRDALTEIEHAVSLDSKNAGRHAQHARCAVLAGFIPQAVRAVKSALSAGVRRADEFMLLASVLVRCDDHEGALALYKEAEKLEPHRNELHRGMATVHRFLGQTAEAEDACNKAVAIDPHDYEMLNLRSSLRKQTSKQNHVKELTGLLENGVKDWRGAVQVAYAVSKECEDLTQYDKAFEYLRQAATLRRKNTRYDVADDIKIFAAIRQALTQSALEEARSVGHPSARPIFVLGLPRTGSTLVERIISSHSAVTTAGELNDFAIELVKLVVATSHGTQPARLDLPAASLKVSMTQLGENYVKAANTRLNITSHFIDKLPLNSLYVGLIHLALPNAKVVHVNRQPLDACLAMYKYLFKNAYPFSYDLEELATYYIEHHRLMEHWRNILPQGWMYDIHYEDIVNNQEAATAELLQYLGLEWEDACLDFHRNKQASTTGSATQVRERVYQSSVGKWRCFERQLQPLTEKLRKAGIHID